MLSRSKQLEVDNDWLVLSLKRLSWLPFQDYKVERSVSLRIYFSEEMSQIVGVSHIINIKQFKYDRFENGFN